MRWRSTGTHTGTFLEVPPTERHVEVHGVTFARFRDDAVDSEWITIGELYDSDRILGWGFVAWAGAVLISMPFWHSELYTGPFARAHPEFGDIGNYVGAAVAVVLYLLTYRLPYLWHRRKAPASATREEPVPR